jgi:UDP-N-acetylmuramate: L-alanyl-gamma-D-glutamyl-meso-diaminopimelate ligase
MHDLQAAKKKTAYLPEVSQIVSFVVGEARSGDVVVVFSNGGFGGIHQKLLDALKANQ